MLDSLNTRLMDLPRTHSVVWMFLTVVFGAIAILTGELPLQIGGTVLIAVGMITPMALVDLQKPSRVRSPGVGSATSTDQRGSIALGSDRPQVDDRPNDTSSVSGVDLEILNREFLNYLVNDFGLDVLGSQAVMEEVFGAIQFRNREPGELLTNFSREELLLIWKRLLFGSDRDKMSLGPNADRIHYQMLRAVRDHLVHGVRWPDRIAAARSEPARLTTNPKAPRGAAVEQVKADLEQEIQQRRATLLATHDADRLLDPHLVDAIIRAIDESPRAPNALPPDQLSRLWRSTVRGGDAESLSIGLGISELHTLIVRKYLLIEAAKLVRRMDDRTAKRRSATA